jgi:hypothetical protein
MAAFAIVATTPVTGSLLDLFWYLTAAGQGIVLLIAATIPEHRLEAASPEVDVRPPTSLREMLNGARAILRMRPLVLFVGAVVVASFADSVTEDAFVMSMITKGLDARALAPLAIAEDIIGLAAPIFAVALARRMGVSRYLSAFLVIPALAVSVLFLDPALWIVVALCLVLDTCEVLWDPVADARLHALIPSRRRATIASVVNQLNGMVALAGLVVFSLIIDRHSEALDAASPDIVAAFSGEFDAPPELPAAALGLPAPDLAIVLFVLVGLLAIPLLRAGAKQRAP